MMNTEIFDYYLVFHILAGYYVTDWFARHVNNYARAINEKDIVGDAKTVMAIYLFWPVLVPSMLIILHFNLRKNKN